MIIKEIHVEKFRAMNEIDLKIGKRMTAVVGRNASMKTTLLGMLSQPFSISKECGMNGEKTLDGYDFRSQFNEKFKLSSIHDKPGDHVWTLKFRNNKIYKDKDYITVKSVASMIVLDKDVEGKRKNQEQKTAVNRSNVLYMPVDVEKGLFEFLKEYSNFNKFRAQLLEKGCNLSYDICFCEWTENEYDTNALKKWFSNLEQSIPSLDILFDFWCKENIELVNDFIESFKSGYNEIANLEGLDYII